MTVPAVLGLAGEVTGAEHAADDRDDLTRIRPETQGTRESQQRSYAREHERHADVFALLEQVLLMSFHPE